MFDRVLKGPCLMYLEVSLYLRQQQKLSQFAKKVLIWVLKEVYHGPVTTNHH